MDETLGGIMKNTLAIALTSLLLACGPALVSGCASMPFTDEDCQELVAIAAEIAISIEEAEISDEEKAARFARYTRIAARLADKACDFVPETFED